MFRHFARLSLILSAGILSSVGSSLSVAQPGWGYPAPNQAAPYVRTGQQSTPARPVPVASTQSGQASVDTNATALTTIDTAEQALIRGDYAEAFCLIKPMAEAGNAQAQFNIGWMYANGYGLRLNEESAFNWWRKAADQDHPDALHAIALAYLHGEGVDKDKVKGFEWLIRSAKHGDDDAMPILVTAIQRGDQRAAELFSELLISNSELFKERRWVKVARANIRQSPDKHAKLITTLSKGQELVRLAVNGNWSQHGIVGDGRVGWIYSPLLSETRIDVPTD